MIRLTNASVKNKRGAILRTSHHEIAPHLFLTPPHQKLSEQIISIKPY